MTEEHKDPKDMTPEERKAIKVNFAPGCFDNFDGTQEELDELIAEIHKMIESGEIFEKAQSLEDVLDEDPELEDILVNQSVASNRRLN